MFKKIGLIGLGLMGGSLAKSIKKYHLADHIVATNRNQDVLLAALAEGVVDEISLDIDGHFSDCDLIFLCCPVQVNVTAFHRLAGIVHNNCIITDVGSTKSDIMDAVAATPYRHLFIGGHPMAGSEKTRYNASSDYLYENAYYILTPYPDTAPSKLDTLYQFVQDIKALPLIMEAERHDFVTATISHVPHVVAASLVNLVKDLDSPEGHMHTLAAGGFKDITRIASSSPTMWQQICMTNRDNVLKVLSKLQEDIEKVKDSIIKDDESSVYEFFDEAGRFRDTFQERFSGALIKAFSITVDVEDKTGIIAKIATLLSGHEISIKNIGIIHNREQQSGVLEIVFYDEQAMNNGVKILIDNGFIVY